MNVLRRLPLPRLIALCVALVALGTGVAVASSIGSGPTPPAASLADAIHQALSASPVGGMTADITLTDSLLPSGITTTGSPLLDGGSGRLWVSADGQARLELQSDSGDTEIYYDAGTLSYYDPRDGGTLQTLVLPSRLTSHVEGRTPTRPTVDAIQQTIDRLMKHASVSGATPTDVAGQPAYRVSIAPSENGGLFGGAAVWWDADHAVPLEVAIYATGDGTPVLDLSVTDVTYGPIDQSVFTPPVAAQTTTTDLSAPAGDHPVRPADGVTPPTLTFTPDEPATLDGQSLTSARTVRVDKTAAELLVYGHGLGGITVLERPTPTSTAAGDGTATTGPGGPQQLTLPTVDINGDTATELPTALGTVLHFTRGGVAYTVLGSIPTADAAAAADGL